jgi:glutaminyl-tRNA synthetase
MADTEQLVAKFLRVGLTEAKAKETVKNKTVSSNLSQLVDWAGEGVDLTGVRGNLLYHTASKTKPQIWSLAPLLVTYITSDKLDTELRLSAAIEHFLKLPPGTKAGDVDTKKLDEAAGVGVVVTAEEVEQAVEDAIKAVKGEIEQARWRFNTGPLMGKVRGQLKWADGKAIKSEFELQLLDLLGPKTDQDLLPPPKVEKKKGEKKKVAKEEKAAGDDVEEDGAATISELMKTKVHFHKPGENYTTDGYVTTPTTRDRLREHLERTGGQVRKQVIHNKF